jgi:D-amino-acid dehydrogenase
MIDVAIVGGGVIGLACAYELSARDAAVCLLDAAELGGGASRGNTGWVVPSLSAPLAAPGALRTALGSMVKGGGAISVRPTLDPGYLRWLWRFARHCSSARYGRGIDALVALNRRTLDLFDEYRADGVEFELHRSGLLVVAHSDAGLRPYAETFAELARRGHDGRVAALSPQAACELEPSLSATRVAGALHARVDRYVRPESLAAGLAARAAARGASLRHATAVTAITRRNGGFELATRGGAIRAARVVIAAGTASPRLVRPLGVRLPVLGAKGYSATVARSAASPRHAVYLAEAKLGVSSYDAATRIAGSFELGARDTAVRSGRVAALLEQAGAYFDGWRPAAQRLVSAWAGLRPATPDGLPLVGAVDGHAGLYVATGHGMLGVTLAPATARLLSRLILDGETGPELAALAVGRRG